MFACLTVCLFGCFVCSFVCPFASSFVRLFVCLFWISDGVQISHASWDAFRIEILLQNCSETGFCIGVYILLSFVWLWQGFPASVGASWAMAGESKSIGSARRYYFCFLARFSAEVQGPCGTI